MMRIIRSLGLHADIKRRCQDGHPVEVTGRRRAIATMLVGIVFLLQIVASGHDRDEPLVISRLVLVESRNADRHIVEETYRAELTHTWPAGRRDFAGVTARIVHPFSLGSPGYLQIVDGEVDFGSVRAGETVESADTF